MNSDVFKFMGDLPDHKNLCKELLEFFSNQSDITAAFLSGSGASGGMDFHSDLDLGFVCKDDEAKERLWKQRFDWPLPSWFHRMDADHVKPYFIKYLYASRVVVLSASVAGNIFFK